MKYLRNSANFVWHASKSSSLGEGATAIVYQGVDKKTGEPVAVKTFKDQSYSLPLDLQMREYEMMKGLSHENIVKLIAIEEEVQSQKKVIILEFCNERSLYAVLEDPQNNYGLEEEEFLCLLKDISAGMKYLRDKEIIHRDLKPGNIMKHISEAHRSSFKLTDFATARVLPDGQKFRTLCGTEEYLHPDMYERYFIQPRVNSFGATIDLWSIGVTLYHAATGLLPFRPFCGKVDKLTMYCITTNKESGVISGIQQTKNGPIEWSRKLPKTCLLSQGLKDLITVLLAGIMENDDKMWTFNQFFEYVTDIISRKVFHVFYMNEGKEIRLYMQPNEMLQDLKNQIFAQLKVPTSKQLLLFDKSTFTSQIDPFLDVSTFPSTTIDRPLMLVHTENTDMNNISRLGSLPACFPTFTSSFNGINLAKTSCIVAHAVKRVVLKLVRCQQLLLRISKILMYLIEDSIAKLCSNSDMLQKKIEDVNHRTDMLRSYSFVFRRVSALSNEQDYKKELQRISGIVSEQNNSVAQVKENVTQLQSSIHSLKHRLQTQWKEALSECSSLTGCAEKADTYVKKMLASWYVFLREQKNTVLPAAGMFHDLEKVKMQQTCEKLNLLKEECLESYLQASRKLIEWYSGMQDIIVGSNHLDKDLVSVRDDLKSYCSSLQEAESEVCRMGERIVPMLKKSFKKEKLSQIQVLKQDNKDFIKIIEQQNSNLERFQRLNLLLAGDKDNREQGKL